MKSIPGTLGLFTALLVYGQETRPDTTTVKGTGPGAYFWTATPVGLSAQLLTLHCRGCYGSVAGREVPLVSVLRDTLGDQDPSNDQVSYVWLLGAPHVSLHARALSAIPFFYWQLGGNSNRITKADLKPQMNLTQPRDPMLSAFNRQLVQSVAFDPLTSWVRASSRSYQMNTAFSGRFEWEQTVSYLRHAPTSDAADGLTEEQVKTVIARLELRKDTIGGMVDNAHAPRFADQAAFENERVRSRNWELLRQCAERTGLVFESIDLGGTQGQYAMLWFPADASEPAWGVSVKSVYKLLNIRDPWKDDRLKHWKDVTFQRSPFDRKLIPFGLYSLNYPKVPLLLIDFRDRMHVRRHEMTQRTINQVASGVVGLSRWSNWYYFAGAMAYNFVAGRHGEAVNMADRLDCYSQFRAQLALDGDLDEKLRNELERRSRALTVSPLDTSGQDLAALARARYDLLRGQASIGSPLLTRLSDDRRAELASFGESTGTELWRTALHFFSFGQYTTRVPKERLDLPTLDHERRFSYQLAFLDRAVRNGTEPEVAMASDQLSQSLAELRGLLPAISSPGLRQHASATVSRMEQLTRDTTVQASCRETLVAMTNHTASSTPVATAAGDAGTPAPAGRTGFISGLR